MTAYFFDLFSKPQLGHRKGELGELGKRDTGVNLSCPNQRGDCYIRSLSIAMVANSNASPYREKGRPSRSPFPQTNRIAPSKHGLYPQENERSAICCYGLGGCEVLELDKLNNLRRSLSLGLNLRLELEHRIHHVPANIRHHIQEQFVSLALVFD